MVCFSIVLPWRKGTQPVFIRLKRTQSQQKWSRQAYYKSFTYYAKYEQNRKTWTYTTIISNTLFTALSMID